MSFVVGLTGGIASGKSSVAKIFAELGAEVIDTDEISRALTRSGAAALKPIREKLGATFFHPDGSLDRALLRRKVFSDAGARKKLEVILHPLIRKEVERNLGAIRSPYALIVVPLLIETQGYASIIDRTLIVDCSEDKQIERLRARSRLSEKEARAIIATQAPRELRLARADDVLDNSGTEELLRGRVTELHRRYLALAGAPRN
ncbi:MAG: dephospho-CoA kinase [Burkholderiales bacterium]